MNRKDSSNISYGMLSKFLFWLSGTDTRLIRQCPVKEQHLQIGNGFAILATGLIAGGSIFFALHTIQKADFFISIPIACLWSLLVMNIDKTIILSFHVGHDDGEEATFFKRYLAPLFVRLPIAAMLGLMIAVPIEISLFRDEIINYIDREKREYNSGGWSQERSRLETEKTDFLKIRDKEERNYNRVSKNFQAKFNDITRHEGSFPYIYEGDERKWVKKGLARRRMERLKKELSFLDTELENANTEKRKAIEHYDAAVVACENYEKKIQEAKQSVSDEGYGFPTMFSTMEKIKKEKRESNDSADFWFSILLRIAFILIESLPALIKVISGRKTYDLLVEYEAGSMTKGISPSGNWDVR